MTDPVRKPGTYYLAQLRKEFQYRFDLTRALELGIDALRWAAEDERRRAGITPEEAKEAVKLIYDIIINGHYLKGEPDE
jgi:hypothetical protein